MKTPSPFSRISIQILCAVVVLLFSTSAFTIEQGQQALMDTYLKYQSRLESNDFNNQIAVDSYVEKGNVSGTVYAVLPHDFAQTREIFQHASNWCTALDLHINVKSCTVSHTQKDRPSVHLYIGDKDYQMPEDAYRFDYQYSIKADTNQYINAELRADTGPLDSKDYLITLQAIPINGNASFIVLKYSAVYGVLTRLMINTYLSTLGRNKVGFTKVGLDKDGNTKYIKGIEGLVERNAMRYMFAIYSYLDSLALPGPQRFEAGLNRWFDFTKKYPRQLYEIGRDEYISNKHRERKNQQSLQLAINKTVRQQNQSDTINTPL